MLYTTSSVMKNALVSEHNDTRLLLSIHKPPSAETVLREYVSACHRATLLDVHRLCGSENGSIGGDPSVGLVEQALFYYRAHRRIVNWFRVLGVSRTADAASCHCEPPQAAWQSPAHSDGDRVVASGSSRRQLSRLQPISCLLDTPRVFALGTLIGRRRLQVGS
jgi:hypothetical protein